MSTIYQHFSTRFKQATKSVSQAKRRIGSELKFPLVNPDGSAAPFKKVEALWQYLADEGWQPVSDPLTGKVVGAKTPGQYNDTVASCETGYCKTEFSLAHVGDLIELEKGIDTLKKLLRPFCEKENVFFLGYGIQPMTPPGKSLLMKKGRSSVWDKIFPANRHIPPEHGDDVHLFTVNAASHVHVSVTPDEAVTAVNVLNGFSGAQIALTANSNIWKGAIDPDYKCVSEKLWDWWMADKSRIGVPQKPFKNLEDYIETVSSFKPVFVTREGKPLLLNQYRSFAEYYHDEQAIGFDLEGKKIPLTPVSEDFDLHCTCYWYNARISHYFTVENRVNDQQPPDDLMTVPALTLGLTSLMGECLEEISANDWRMLRLAREAACRNGISGIAGNIGLREQASKMLDLAREGLIKRGRGEERYLEPLDRRIRQKFCPADRAARLFNDGGIEKLVQNTML